MVEVRGAVLGEHGHPHLVVRRRVADHLRGQQPLHQDAVLILKHEMECMKNVVLCIEINDVIFFCKYMKWIRFQILSSYEIKY